MAYFTYDSAGARTVEAKGDIRDVITRLSVDSHPLLAKLPAEPTQDIQPKSPEDSLSAVNNANAYAENATAPAAVDTARTLNDNYVQHLLKTAEVTTTQNAVAQYGIGNELVYQEAKKIIEIMRDGEAILVSDQAKQAPTAANSRVGKMAGLSALITSNTDQVADWSLANLEVILAAIVAAGGISVDGQLEAWMDATRKIAADAWTTTPTRYTSAIKQLEKEVLLVHTSFGGVKMYWHPYLPQDIVSSAAHVLILDPSLWQIRTLIPLNRSSMAITGTARATLLEWAFCPLSLAQAGNGQFY